MIVGIGIDVAEVKRIAEVIESQGERFLRRVFSHGVRWVDLEVVRHRGRRPTLELKGEARKIADGLGVKNIALSITHTVEQAIAQVIFES